MGKTYIIYIYIMYVFPIPVLLCYLVSILTVFLHTIIYIRSYLFYLFLLRINMATFNDSEFFCLVFINMFNDFLNRSNIPVQNLFQILITLFSYIFFFYNVRKIWKKNHCFDCLRVQRKYLIFNRFLQVKKFPYRRVK